MANTEFNTEVEKLRNDAQYAHLSKSNESGIHNPTLVAINIKKELKKAFPNLKFSVKQSRRGNIDVTCKNERVAEAAGIVDLKAIVRNLVEPYMLGSFDSLTDLYVEKPTPRNETFGGVRYISVF